MLFLDKCIKAILLEEGQLLVSLEDLGITSDDLNQLFESIYEQSRPYIQRYVKKSLTLSTSPITLPDAVSIKRVVYNTYMNNYDRIMADVPTKYWDFDPHSRTLTTYVSTSFIVEYLCYPKCGNLELSESILLNDGRGMLKLPCSPDELTLKLMLDTLECVSETKDKITTFKINDKEVATLDLSTLKLYINASEYNTALFTYTTLNYAIEEWDMKAEIFMVWFKAALLSMIGAIKEQAGNIDSAAMPFDINRDGILARARELYAKLDELKTTKSTWWEF